MLINWIYKRYAFYNEDMRIKLFFLNNDIRIIK